MEPLEGNAIIDLSIPVAFSIIERLTGGTGGTETAVRELTEIEEALIEGVISDGLRILKASMGELIHATPRLEAIEYNPQLTQIVPPSEITLFVSMEVKMGTDRGMVGICLPYLMLEPILENLSTERIFKRKKLGQEETNFSEIIAQLLEPVELTLKVELGRVMITVKEVLELNTNDVIRLPALITEPLKVFIGDDPQPRLLARPGIIGRHKGIEIMDFLES